MMIMDPNLTWIMIYKMLLMLPSASFMLLSESGNHYKWDVHPSPPQSPWQKRKGECHMSWTMMPAPEIRPLQFNFLFLSQYLSPRSSCSLSSPGQTKTKLSSRIGDVHQSNPYLSHQNWYWNSNLVLLYLFSSATITSAASKMTAISTISLNGSSLISFFCL